MRPATASIVLLLGCHAAGEKASAPAGTATAPGTGAASAPSAGAPSAAAQATPERADRSMALPAKISGFDGWRGVKVQRGLRCQNCCDLVYPAEFGAKPDELKLLEEIVNGHDIDHDFTDCMVPRMEDTLDQIKRLAVDRQDRAAALVLLRAKSEGGLDLGGGELAETYAAGYLVPTLLGYRRLGEILTPALERHVATQVCAAAFGPMSDEIDPDAIVARLKASGAGSLAKRITSTCKRIQKEMTP